MKLEYKFKEAVFLGPKIYGGITDTNQYICKVKGYKNVKEIPFNILKTLLMKDSSAKLYYTKWFKNISASEINMREQIYSLMKTDYKREFIYNNEGKAIDTKAFLCK